MKQISKKYEYSCQNCSRSYLAYPSTRRGKTHACSKACAAELRKTHQTGERNPNYRHGKHCTDSICACGAIKDYRAIKCTKCTQLHQPQEGYTRDIAGIIKAVKNAKSYVEAAHLCGENRTKICKIVAQLSLDTSHFVICKDRPTPPEQLFCIHSKRQNAKIRRYLIEHEILDYRCAVCGLEDYWQEKNLTLELDHINGDCCDNHLDNLRFLCPNCHSQTSTFRGRNINAINTERS